MLESILHPGYGFSIVVIAYLINKAVRTQYIAEQKRAIVAVVGIIVAVIFIGVDYLLGEKIEWKPLFVTFWVSVGFYSIFLKPILSLKKRVEDEVGDDID